MNRSTSLFPRILGLFAAMTLPMIVLACSAEDGAGGGVTPAADTAAATDGGADGQANADSGTTSANDAGTTKPEDTGSTQPQDSGATKPEDAGTTTPEDAGTTKPEDAGTTQAEDTGTTPPKDAGSTDPVDAGSPDPVDAGPPPCKETNKGVEKCDGLDNDCDGKTDNAANDASNDALCDDGNICTNHSCGGTKGCQLAFAATPCDDNNACTVGDKCTKGTCMAGAAKCNDNNVCTADSCDSKTGACKNTEILGCKACSNVSQCDDGKQCTKDACTGGKCSNTAIAGCVGPLDYEVVAVTPKTPSLYLPNPLALKLTVRNEGKQYTGSYPGIMTFQVYLSADKKIENGDYLLYSNKWKAYNIGKPKTTEASMDINVGVGAGGNTVGKKYVCARVKHNEDKNLTNNELCTPIKLIQPDFTALSLAVNNPTAVYKAGQTAYFTHSFKNNGGKANSVHVMLWMSADNKLDAGDLKALPYPTNVGAVEQGATFTKKNWKWSVPGTAQKTHKFLCVQVNVWGDAWKKESNPDDNVACGPIVVSNPPNIGYSSNDMYFKLQGGSIYGNVPFGGMHTGFVRYVKNAGAGHLDGSFGIRMWLADATNWPYESNLVKWKTEWTWTGKIAAGGQVKDVTGDKHAKLAPDTVGVKYLCADMNWDKKLEETSYANKLCRKITVLGVDLFVEPGKSKVGATSWKNPQPGTLKRDVDLNIEYFFCNQGNQVLKAKAKGLNQRILLSKDKVPSADDVVLGQTDEFGFNQIGGVQLGGKPSCGGSVMMNKKAKIPTTVTPGNYYLLFDVNADEKWPEPMGNNLLIKPVQVQ